VICFPNKVFNDEIETWQITIVRAPEISVMINASLKIAIKVAICEHQLSYESDLLRAG